MAATIRRAPAKTGLVLLESSVQIAEDGFVSIPARFLAPETGLAATDFLIDSEWPLSALPNGLPAIQAGPFLASRTIEKRNGLTYIEATYVSALNPVRIVESSTDAVARFSGYEPPVQVGLTFTETGALLAFDYIARSITYSYAVAGENSFAKDFPSGVIGSRFNIVSSGNISRVQTQVSQVRTQQIEKVGRVKRISITATPTIVQTGQAAQNMALLAAVQSYSI